VKKNHDRILSVRKGRARTTTTGWGDLVCMFQRASRIPAARPAFLDANPSCKLEGGNTHAVHVPLDTHVEETLGLMRRV